MTLEERLESACDRLAAALERETVLWKILEEEGVDLLRLKQRVRDKLQDLHNPRAVVEAQANMLKFALDKILSPSFPGRDKDARP